MQGLRVAIRGTGLGFRSTRVVKKQGIGQEFRATGRKGHHVRIGYRGYSGRESAHMAGIWGTWVVQYRALGRKSGHWE
jgi:hypothetical protein